MGCFGVVTGTILLLIATVVVLALIITAFGADADEIPSGLLMFLFIIVMSIIGEGSECVQEINKIMEKLRRCFLQISVYKCKDNQIVCQVNASMI